MPVKGACQARRKPAFLKQAEIHLETLARQLVFRYDSCLSKEYGGIPLMDRAYISGDNIGAKLANLIYYRDWDEAFKASEEATVGLAESWKKDHKCWKNISNIEQFNELYNYFMEHFREHIPREMLENKPYTFWSPASDELKINLTEGDRWNDDSVFGQERLIGVNPVQIQRVTPNGSKVGMTINTLFNGRLSNSFNWNEAVRNVTGMNVTQVRRFWPEYSTNTCSAVSSAKPEYSTNTCTTVSSAKPEYSTNTCTAVSSANVKC